MTDPRPRLTMATALPGTRVVSVDDGFYGSPRIKAGETYEIEEVGWDGHIRLRGGTKSPGSGWSMSRFVLAAPPEPALPAMPPELVAALREAHERLSCNSGPPGCLTDRIMRAIAACPGLLAPPPPRTTDATFWLGEAA